MTLLLWTCLFLAGCYVASADKQFPFNCTTTMQCYEISGNISKTTISTAIRGLPGLRGPKGDKGDSCNCTSERRGVTDYSKLAMNGTLDAAVIKGEKGESGNSCDCEPIKDAVQNLTRDVEDMKFEFRNKSDNLKVIKGEKGDKGECVQAKSEIRAMNGQLSVMRNRMKRLENQLRGLHMSSMPSRISSNPLKFLNDTLKYYPAKCSEIQQSEKLQNISIFPLKTYLDLSPYYVNCTSGGWIVIQRRTNAGLSFYRAFINYREGFGDKNGDFWIGLRTIRRLTSSAPHKLRIVMRYKENPSETVYVEYGYFFIENENQGYRLIVADYTGNAPDYLRENVGRSFSADDLDRDTHSTYHCARSRNGGWWYTGCGSATPNDNFLDYFTWGKPLIYSEMKIQPV